MGCQGLKLPGGPTIATEVPEAHGPYGLTGGLPSHRADATPSSPPRPCTLTSATAPALSDGGEASMASYREGPGCPGG